MFKLAILLVLILNSANFCDAAFEAVHGHCSMTQGPSIAMCFQPLTIVKSQQSAMFDTDTWRSSKQIARILHIDNYDSKARFMRNPLLDYLRDTDGNDFSISLNLLIKVSHSHEISYSFNQKEVLSPYGKEILDRTRQDFNIICGNSLLNGYEEGAVLIITLKITFRTITDKKNFQLVVGLKPSAFLDPSLALDYKGAEVTISAFQLGGLPAKLSSALSINSVKCSLSKPDQCQESLQMLLTYAKEEFPKQLTSASEAEGNVFVPLGYTNGPLLSDIGFNISPSNFSRDIFDARKDLVNAWEFSMDQKTTLKMLANLGIGGDFVKKNLKKVESNLDILENGLLYGPAIDCWNRPSSCKNISEEILQALETVDYEPKSSKLCGKPEDAGIMLADACANLKGVYISTIWESGNFMESSLPDPVDQMCYAKAVGIKKTLDGILRIPCQVQVYLPTNPFV